MKRPVYVGMSKLDIIKTLMYKFWYEYIKPKYGDRVKLCYTDTDSITARIMTEEFYRDIAGDVKRWFATSNYDENNKTPFPIGKNKKVYGFFKDELGGKIMEEFVALRPKTYAYVMDDDSEKNIAKGTKKCVIKRILKFNDCKKCQSNDKIILKSQHRFKSDCYNVCTEQINKIALSSNDDKRLETI